MPRGLAFIHHGVLIFLHSLLVLMLTGCLGDWGTPAALSPAPAEACEPAPTENVNIYRTEPQAWVGDIFARAHSTPFQGDPLNTPDPTLPLLFGDQAYTGARYAALQKLIEETDRWSDTETIKFEDSTKIRITLTFISPELIQAAFLNQALKDNVNTADFQTYLQSALNTVAERNELMFLLTVTTLNNDLSPFQHKIKLPIESIYLLNSENLPIPHSHDDPNLGQNIDITSESVSGYIAFPFTVLSGDQCKWILNPKYNTKIVITMPFAELDGVSDKNPYSWTIHYTSLVNSNMPANPANAAIPPGFNPALETPLLAPPIELNAPDYLKNFAKFIWGQIIENY